MSTPLVFAPKKDALRAKLRLLLQQGPTKLKIISDFDSTLSTTKGSSWTAVERFEGLSQQYRDECHRLLEYYYPKEIDPNLTLDERVVFMLEWLAGASKALIDEKCSRVSYHNLLLSAQSDIDLRQGCDELFTISHHSKLDVPILVFSAGIGDVIDAVLLHHFQSHYQTQNPFYPIQPVDKMIPEDEPTSPNSPLPPDALQDKVEHNPGYVVSAPKNVYIIANHLAFCTAADGVLVNRFDASTFRDDDLICGFEKQHETAIHVFNKHEALVKRADYYQEKIAPRTNVLLLGDSLGDSVMVCPHTSTDNVVRIAFLNTSKSKTVESHLNAYLKAFDIIFVDSDAGIAFCNIILHHLEDHVKTDEEVIEELLQYVVEQEVVEVQ